MDYMVIERFRDKYTGELILPGATFICEETDRIKDLIERSLIKELDHDWESKTKKEIMAALFDRGIEFDEKQTKTGLIKLLQGGD